MSELTDTSSSSDLTSVDIDSLQSNNHHDGADVNLLQNNVKVKFEQEFEEASKNRGFYSKWILPRLEKGFISNLCTFTLMLFGRILLIFFPQSIVVQMIYAFGLFGFAGGVTNWLAIKMLFDRVPGLYGSGVIPNRFKEIRETVKNVIMATFFDEEYLKKYLTTKAESLLASINLQEKIAELLDSPAVDAIIEKKLAELGTRPEGMLFVMMGINPTSLKPMVKPFVAGMGTELVPFLMSNFDLTKLLNISSIRTEIDKLMTTKLQELTPERVKALLETVIRSHLGWLIVWGNVFGGIIGVITIAVDLLSG